MAHKRIAVLGGGVAGIVTAHHLRRGGIDVDLIEKEDHLGGLHRSVEIDGCHYDIGTFIFNHDHEYFSCFPELRDLFPAVDHDNRALTPGGTLDDFPLSLRGYLRDNGAGTTALDLLEILSGKYSNRRKNDLHAFVHYYVGRRLYTRSGLQNYIERLYGTPDDQIDIEFARRRLDVLAEKCSIRRNTGELLGRLIRNRMTPAWNCRVRPAGGFRVAYDRIAAELSRSGVRILTGYSVSAIGTSAGVFEVHGPDRTERYDRVVSTIPMETTAGLLGIDLPFQPDYMNLVSLLYRTSGDPGFSSACLYNFSLDGNWKRITTFSRYYGLHRGEHYFTVECTSRDHDPQTLESARRAFEASLGRFPVLKGRLRFQGGCVTKRAYPVYRRGDARLLQMSREMLRAMGIEIVGRQGNFAYESSARVARQSRETAMRVRSDL